jgi:hypothetical protein
MIERIDDDGGLGGEPDRAEQMFFEIRPDRGDRVEQQQQPAAAGQIPDQHIGLARRERGARADIGNDGTVGRDGIGLRRHDAAHLIADLGERQLQPVELLRRRLQHIAGTRHVVAAERLDVAIVKMPPGRAEGLAVAGEKTDGLGPLLEHAQRRIGQAGRVGGVLHQHLAVAGLQHGGVVGTDAEVAGEPGLLVEIDGAEREQRMAARGNGDQVSGVERVRIAGIVEISQRQRHAQIADDRRELRRRCVASFAADVEMHVVAKQRDVGGNHDRNRRSSHQDGRDPG